MPQRTSDATTYPDSRFWSFLGTLLQLLAKKKRHTDPQGQVDIFTAPKVHAIVKPADFEKERFVDRPNGSHRTGTSAKKVFNENIHVAI